MLGRGMVSMPNAAMNRRTFACGLGSLVAGVPSACCARSWPSIGYWGARRRIPSIIVVSDPYDLRLPVVHEAVSFWNSMFLNLGSPFRLGSVSHITEVLPADDVRRNLHRDLDQFLKILGS